jgi:hypothetical protein
LSMMRRAARAPCRRAPLSSNGRRHRMGARCLPNSRFAAVPMLMLRSTPILCPHSARPLRSHAQALNSRPCRAPNRGAELPLSLPVVQRGLALHWAPASIGSCRPRRTRSWSRAAGQRLRQRCWATPARGAGSWFVRRGSRVGTVCRVRAPCLRSPRRLTRRSSGRATAWHLAREAHAGYHAPRGPSAMPLRAAQLQR